jgi:hypothetical protein
VLSSVFFVKPRHLYFPFLFCLFAMILFLFVFLG